MNIAFVHQGGRRGFTLVELVASMTVIATLATVSSVLIFNATKAYREISVRARLHSAASLALTRLSAELRSIRLAQSSPAVIPLVDSVGAASLSWEGDHSLSLNGTDLELVLDGGSPAVLLRGVRALSVTAFDDSNASLASALSGAACASVRRLRVSVTVESAGIVETVATKVYLRSTMIGGGV